MRALRGNTVADMFNVALWNARGFHADASPAREASWAKMRWIMRRLQEEDVDVCFLLATREEGAARSVAKLIAPISTRRAEPHMLDPRFVSHNRC